MRLTVEEVTPAMQARLKLLTTLVEQKLLYHLSPEEVYAATDSILARKSFVPPMSGLFD